MVIDTCVVVFENRVLKMLFYIFKTKIINKCNQVLIPAMTAIDVVTPSLQQHPLFTGSGTDIQLSAIGIRNQINSLLMFQCRNPISFFLVTIISSCS